MICVFLNFVFSAKCQDYIHRDYFGSGNTREAALDALLMQIHNSVPFENPAVLSTYRADISKEVIEQNSQGKYSMSLSGTTLDRIFQVRQTRAAGILTEGRNAGTDSVRKNYYIWAYYYLLSLPSGHKLPGKEEIRSWLLSHEGTEIASLQVPMTHIENEVSAIRRIVGDIYAEPERVTKVKIAKEDTAQEIPVAVKPQLELMAPCHSFGEAIAVAPSCENRLANGCPSIYTPFPVPPQKLKKNLLMTAGFAPDFVVGAMASVRKQWGAVIAFQSDFSTPEYSFTAISDGTVPSGGFIWPSGQTRHSCMMLTAGGSRSIIPCLDAYVTAGYGFRRVFWEDSDGNWAKMQDLSSAGMALSAGLLFNRKYFATTLNVFTIAFQNLGITFGIGLDF